MRVCDITRSDEVVGQVSIQVTESGDQDSDQGVVTLDVGKRALDAFKAGAWGELNSLIPPALRVKDPKKQAAAKKAAQSRAANRGQQASQAAQAAPTGSPEAGGTPGAAKAGATSQEPQGAAGDGGF
jgi:hypothetical protein